MAPILDKIRNLIATTDDPILLRRRLANYNVRDIAAATTGPGWTYDEDGNLTAKDVDGITRILIRKNDGAILCYDYRSNLRIRLDPDNQKIQTYWPSTDPEAPGSAGATGFNSDNASLTAGREDGSRLVAFEDGYVVLPQLPTSDPGSPGRVWNDNGTLKISSG